MYLKPGDLNYSEETCQRKSWNTSLQHQFILQDRSHPPVSFKQISFQKANAITLSLDTSHLYCFQEKNIFKKVITKYLMLLKLTALLPRRRSFGQQEFSLALLFFFSHHKDRKQALLDQSIFSSMFISSPEGIPSFPFICGKKWHK